jgi:xanthine/uracil/vitamin C permease (AzgA family)
MENGNHTNLRTEAIAGVTTFFTMAYIVVVNPSTLSTEETGIAFSGVLTAPFRHVKISVDSFAQPSGL